MKAIAKTIRYALAGMTAAVLTGCGSVPIHATFDNLTNETVSRTSDYFDFSSFISISGLAPQHGAQLMFHQPEFYDLKPGSPSYAIGVSPGRSFIAEKIYPMNAVGCQKTTPTQHQRDSEVVRDIRNALEDARNLAIDLTARRVEKELADTLLPQLLSNQDATKAGLAKQLSSDLGDGKTAVQALARLEKLDGEKKAALKAKVDAFIKQCGPAADKSAAKGKAAATNAAGTESSAPKCGDAATADVLAQAQQLSDSLRESHKPDGALALKLKKALGKTKLTDDNQAVLAKALLGDKAVDADNNVDYGDLAVKAQAATLEIERLQAEINTSAKLVRDRATHSNVVITRWVREKRNSISSKLSSVLDIGSQNHEVKSGILVLGDLRTTTLFTGEDFIDLLHYSKDRYLGFLDNIGITTFAIQAKHLAYAADKDAESSVAANFSLTPEQLKTLSNAFKDADLKVNVGFGVGLDLGNSALISGSSVTDKTRLFFPPAAFEEAIRQEIRDSDGYQTVFAVRAKVKTPFIDAAMRINTELGDQAQRKIAGEALKPCELRKCANGRIVRSVGEMGGAALCADPLDCRQFRSASGGSAPPPECANDVRAECLQHQLAARLSRVVASDDATLKDKACDDKK